MPDQTYISQEWKKDILKEIRIVSAQVMEKLGRQKSCRRSRARPEPPGMRGLEAREAHSQGTGSGGGERVCSARAEGRDPPGAGVGSCSGLCL